MSSYLAQQALKNKQFVKAFRHGEVAYRPVQRNGSSYRDFVFWREFQGSSGACEESVNPIFIHGARPTGKCHMTC